MRALLIKTLIRDSQISHSNQINGVRRGGGGSYHSLDQFTWYKILRGGGGGDSF